MRCELLLAKYSITRCQKQVSIALFSIMWIAITECCESEKIFTTWLPIAASQSFHRQGRHTMVNALEMQAGNRFEGIVASSVQPSSQIAGFRYFQGGHPTPNAESIRAADTSSKASPAKLRILSALSA